MDLVEISNSVPLFLLYVHGFLPSCCFCRSAKRVLSRKHGPKHGRKRQSMHYSEQRGPIPRQSMYYRVKARQSMYYRVLLRTGQKAQQPLNPIPRQSMYYRVKARCQSTARHCIISPSRPFGLDGLVVVVVVVVVG